MTRVGLKVTISRKVAAGVGDAWIRKVITETLHSAKVRWSVEIGVALVGNAEMRRLNRQYRGKDKTTDVLSFGMGGPDEPLGDIIISVPQIRRQARENDVSTKREFSMMLAHGVLHLLGHDHVKPKDAGKMFGLQDAALKRLKL